MSNRSAATNCQSTVSVIRSSMPSAHNSAALAYATSPKLNFAIHYTLARVMCATEAYTDQMPTSCLCESLTEVIEAGAGKNTSMMMHAKQRHCKS